MTRGRRRRLRAAARAGSAALALVCVIAPTMAWAGPPFLTDDPEPTETGHWEIYAPAADAAGKGQAYDGAVGAELNYGAAPNVQVTVGLPVAYAHEASGLRTGRGDLELSVKYRFLHDATTGLSLAAFPGLTLPTASGGLGSRNVTALLPVWAQKDMGDWAVFGGGGYAINPGRENHNYWTGGVAVTRRWSERLLTGVEIDRQGADVVGGRAATSLGVGAIMQLKAPFRVLASVGPTFVDGRNAAGFHAYAALGVDF
jgi:hypothetical protein